MKKLLLCLIIFFPCVAIADQIYYGYNAMGEYVPISVNGQNINYGYNAVGEYVPVSTSNPYNSRETTEIEYGYNAVGDFVPIRTYNPYGDDEY